MAHAKKARAIGFNHVALEVGDIDEALAFYGRLFDFELRSRSKTSAFIDLGDQFLALQKGRTQPADDGRHFGLVVDDKEAVRRTLAEAGVETLPGQFLDFLDPWGNRIEIVSYDNVQFTKAPNVLRGMGLLQSAHPAQSPVAAEHSPTCPNPRRVTSRGCESAARMTAANVSHNRASACLCAPSSGTSSGRSRGHDSGDNFAASITGRGRSLVVALSLQRVADRAVRAVTHRA
jgi:lactoylglutathione lyase